MATITPSMVVADAGVFDADTPTIGAIGFFRLEANLISAYNSTRGRLAQRLEHPVYTRKVQRSNR
jgi:hypothetical protein